MFSINTSLVALAAYLLCTANAYGDSWALTQTTTTNTATTLSQTTVSNAKQGVNMINLNHSNGVVVNANQVFTTNGNDLTLSQDVVTSSHQAINYIAAAHITEAAQVVNHVDEVLLQQTNSSSNSTQALNMAITAGAGSQIDKLTQTVSANSMSFDGAGSGNIQAGNYIQADSISSTVGNVVQNFNVNGNVSYALIGSNNLQAGNVVIKNSGFDPAGKVTQNFSAGNVDASFSETDANGSVIAANYFAERI